MTTPNPLRTQVDVGTIRASLILPANAVRDLNRFSRGIRADNGRDRILWMSLPSFAPAGSAPLIGGVQMMPVENVSYYSNPKAVSDNRRRILTATEAEDPSGSATFRTANYRLTTHIDEARLRVDWYEGYASHGGPYGLRNLAFSPLIAVSWVYWDLLNEKVLHAYNGYVDDFDEVESIEGVTATMSIMPENDLRTSTFPLDPSNPPTNVGVFNLIQWPPGPI